MSTEELPEMLKKHMDKNGVHYGKTITGILLVMYKAGLAQGREENAETQEEFENVNRMLAESLYEIDGLKVQLEAIQKHDRDMGNENAAYEDSLLYTNNLNKELKEQLEASQVRVRELEARYNSIRNHVRALNLCLEGEPHGS